MDKTHFGYYCKGCDGAFVDEKPFGHRHVCVPGEPKVFLLNPVLEMIEYDHNNQKKVERFEGLIKRRGAKK